MDFLKTAVIYARLGFEVLPLMPNSKIPCKTSVFSNGSLTATSNADLVTEHWQQPKYRDCNIGIKLGGVNRLIVIDVDTHKVNGHETLASIEKSHSKLTTTFTVDTPTGGKHYYYKLPAGEEEERRIEVFNGIDCLSNGYIVASPSTINGGKYKVSSQLNIRQIATIPSWWLSLIRGDTDNDTPKQINSSYNAPMGTGKKYTGQFLDELVAGAEVGNRNDWIMRLTSKMLAVGAEYDTIYKLLLIANDNFLTDPIPLSEINATFKSRVKKHSQRGA